MSFMIKEKIKSFFKRFFKTVAVAFIIFIIIFIIIRCSLYNDNLGLCLLLSIFIPVIIPFIIIISYVEIYKYFKEKERKSILNRLSDCVMHNLNYDKLANEKTKSIHYDIFDDKVIDSWDDIKESIYELEVLYALDAEECQKIKDIYKRKFPTEKEFEFKYIIEDIDNKVDELASKKISQKIDEIKKIIKRIESGVEEHHSVLLRKKNQKIKVDDYGIEDTSEWEKEVKYFLNNVVFVRDNENFDNYIILIQMLLLKYSESMEKEKEVEFDANMSGWEYEEFCKEKLESLGYNVQKTKGSNDQGVDLIVNNDKKIVIQCKHHSKPIGNKAVQEVFTGKHHLGADIAIVVASSTFTKSAKELANTTGVILLHHDELNSISELMSS